ncbi:hypothetical protein LIP36_11080 [Amedibacillus dolichus]|jgi:hypothetical protein|uniref:hypothetical protein n=1 Tax=Bacillota TaxID=1239 RepID=UPI001D00FDE9|nr:MULTISPECIES: hypothetical protein [Bacillota]MCB5374130.1 hypothetical protein [Amedibacillus dolichus]MCG4581122.1 hypothetical protein [Clostridium cochlearium]
MKTSEFLQGRDVERQALTRYINRHPELFKNHIKKDGKEIDLDDEAVAILDEVYPLIKPVELINGVPKEVHIQLQNELIKTQKENSELMKALLKVNEQLAIANTEKLLLEEKAKQFEELKEQNKSISDELSVTKVELEKEKSKSWWDKLRRK